MAISKNPARWGPCRTPARPALKKVCSEAAFLAIVMPACAEDSFTRSVVRRRPSPVHHWPNFAAWYMICGWAGSASRGSVFARTSLTGYSMVSRPSHRPVVSPLRGVVADQAVQPVRIQPAKEGLDFRRRPTVGQFRASTCVGALHRIDDARARLAPVSADVGSRPMCNFGRGAIAVLPQHGHRHPPSTFTPAASAPAPSGRRAGVVVAPDAGDESNF